MTVLDDAIAKTQKELGWRGPSGQPQKYVVLERHFAQALLAEIDNHRSYQDRVAIWLHACFEMDHITDVKVRAFRFLEESLELCQALDVTPAEAFKLIAYVYERPIGDAQQEVGGVLVTLAALCYCCKYHMTECGETELQRAWKNIAKIRAKQAAKPNFSRNPLPGAS